MIGDDIIYFDHYGGTIFSGHPAASGLATDKIMKEEFLNSADPNRYVDFATSPYSGTHKIPDMLINAE